MYDLPPGFYQVVEEAMKAAGFDQQPIAAASAPTIKKNRKLSAYNIFMKEKSAELKKEEVPSNERMSKIGALWKGLSDEQKDEYKAKADEHNASVAPSTVTIKKATKSGPKKLTGYQYFVKEKMPEVRADESIAPKARMGAIGALWKALSDEQKAEWKVQAEALSAETLET